MLAVISVHRLFAAKNKLIRRTVKVRISFAKYSIVRFVKRQTVEKAEEIFQHDKISTTTEGYFFAGQ
jgi:hypothetical protein